MSPELAQFIFENKNLINQNTKESWEEIYNKLRGKRYIGEFTKAILNARINDPAEIMGHIPNFYLEYSTLETYKIPNSVASIGAAAFNSCKNLIYIEIPNSVTTINHSSFIRCNSLTNITIPDSITTIKNNAFTGCKNLTTVELPNTLTDIGEGIFDYCPLLEKIHFKGTKQEAIKCGIGNKANKKWRIDSSIQKIICTDGIIEL